MNRLVILVNLPRGAICPCCNEPLRSEITRIFEGVGVCEQCSNNAGFLGLGEIIEAARRCGENGWWAGDKGLVFCCPPGNWNNRIGYALQARCGLIDDVRIAIRGDGDGI